MDRVKVAARRAKLGLTQAQVADRADMTQQAYARVESGARDDVRLSTAERIAAALGVKLDTLLASPKPKRRPAK